MLFNSFIFLLGFLPLTLLAYFAAARMSPRAALGVLCIASLVFYGWWDARYLVLIAASISLNYAAGRALLRGIGAGRRQRWLLGAAIAANLLLLAVYKYADFFITTASQLAQEPLPLLQLALPLGISFFTFTQIAFLVDASKGKVDSLSPVNYALFVTFFPHLIAGPILHHREMMPQFDGPQAARFDASNFALGLFLLAIGLVKKLLIADQFAPLAASGFDGWQNLDTPAAWLTSLAYTIQLYFDFSGYTDMALGLAWMFNIRLPQNFDSPYRATSIQDFWRRWHMTLSRFLRDYLYIPLGGGRGGRLATLRNLFITFLLGGLWHGAGWTFIVWGALHGVALVMHRLWSWSGRRMATLPAWLLTFIFINFTWVYFRASSLAQANAIVSAMLGLRDGPATLGVTQLARQAAERGQGLFGTSSGPVALVLAVTGAVLVGAWLGPNSIALASRFKPRIALGIVSGIGLATAILVMQRPTEFLYFNF
ncbi:MAG: MBOAT family O-acyltransferase [Pseudomonadota bacterium]